MPNKPVTRVLVTPGTQDCQQIQFAPDLSNDRRGFRMSQQEARIAKAQQPAIDAMRLHPFYHGKIQMMPKCPVRSFADFAIWYTPGVAAPCRAIEESPRLVFEHTNKANTVAVISNGTRVLGLGNIGPEAGLPVMEGKALLFKYLGGVDAVPLCLRTEDPEELIRTVEILEPSFGGINLEDISQPDCFQILDALRGRLKIPVWHDDQQGSATVLLAGLMNALEVVGKKIDAIKIAMIGMGAANVSVYRLLKSAGVQPESVIACDRQGTLHRCRTDIESDRERFRDKWQVCCETNVDQLTGSIEDALRGADVCISFASPGPNLIRPEWIHSMQRDAIVFACANPIPEIWPWDAIDAGARIVATGRGDFPNQVNNSLGFPGIFRGCLDVRAETIRDEMAIAAAKELAACAAEQGLSEERIVPRMDQWEVFPRVAVATALEAQRLEIATLRKTRDQLLDEATSIIQNARAAADQLCKHGIIPAPP
jgi:malate dehydrogenase (oxaloacetate-decarboxylating)